nr:MAG TPA: hypothetical protein [Caudoviricetes sp.]
MAKPRRRIISNAISPTNRRGFFMRLKRKTSQKHGGFL